MKTEIDLAIQGAMLKLAEQIRRASKGCRDGYYDSDEERAATSTRRETLDDVASAIDAAFDVNSNA